MYLESIEMIFLHLRCLLDLAKGSNVICVYKLRVRGALGLSVIVWLIGVSGGEVCVVG